MKRKSKKRNGKTINRHHLKPKSRGGQSVESNLLAIEIKRHNAWHILWGNRTLDEVIALLTRLKQIKESKRFVSYI